eukprot:648930-Pleurochrysis_carterae.AAC.1
MRCEKDLQSHLEAVIALRAVGIDLFLSAIYLSPVPALNDSKLGGPFCIQATPAARIARTQDASRRQGGGEAPGRPQC